MSESNNTPRIYVACLSSYNAGTLHGRWIGADQDTDAIREEIRAMLAESRHEPAEEWAIHDYEGFGEIKLSEYEDIDKVAELARLIGEYDGAFLAYAAHVGSDYATEDGFRYAYSGEYRSPEDYAEEQANDCYGADKLGPLSNYIDWERYAHDMEYDGVAFIPDGQGVYVFHNI